MLIKCVLTIQSTHVKTKKKGRHFLWCITYLGGFHFEQQVGTHSTKQSKLGSQKNAICIKHPKPRIKLVGKESDAIETGASSIAVIYYRVSLLPGQDYSVQCRSAGGH